MHLFRDKPERDRGGSRRYSARYLQNGARVSRPENEQHDVQLTIARHRVQREKTPRLVSVFASRDYHRIGRSLVRVEVTCIFTHINTGTRTPMAPQDAALRKCMRGGKSKRLFSKRARRVLHTLHVRWSCPAGRRLLLHRMWVLRRYQRGVRSKSTQRGWLAAAARRVPGNGNRVRPAAAGARGVHEGKHREFPSRYHRPAALNRLPCFFMLHLRARTRCMDLRLMVCVRPVHGILFGWDLERASRAAPGSLHGWERFPGRLPLCCRSWLNAWWFNVTLIELYRA